MVRSPALPFYHLPHGWFLSESCENWKILQKHLYQTLLQAEILCKDLGTMGFNYLAALVPIMWKPIY